MLLATVLRLSTVGAPAADTLPISALAIGAIPGVLGAAYLLSGASIGRRPVAASAGLRAMALVVSLAAALIAANVTGSPLLALAALGGGVIAAIAFWFTAESILPLERRPTVLPTRAARIAVVLCVFVVAMIVSYASRAALSTMIAPDTAGYWATPGDLVKATPGAVPIRTPFYSALFALVQLAGGAGRTFLMVQFALRALGAAAIAWLASRSSLAAGAVVGLALALDPVSAVTSTAYLTESLYTSALELALVLAVAQLTRVSPARPALLVLLGIGFGVALLVRPTSAALIVAILIASLLVTRSPAGTAWVGAGYGAVVLAIAAYNYARAGLFVLVTTGLYLAFPLFVQHLMDPRNGPASRILHERLIACDPALDYSGVTLETANQFVYTKLLPCTVGANEADRPAAYQLYGRVYREAFFAHPLVFTWRLLLESARFLAVPVSYYVAEQVSFNEVMHVSQACEGRPPYSRYPAGLIAFICPVPPGDPALRALLDKSAVSLRTVYQPYFYPYEHRFEPTYSPELTGAAGVLFFGLALALSRPPYRPLIGGAALVILYNAAATAFGQVTIPRYVAVISPFFLIVNGLFLVSLLEYAAATVRAGRAGRVQHALAEGPR